ncbi:MAG: NAD-dependent epimerase/dehydratase family protein [Burkholderiaceae bacterium]
MPPTIALFGAAGAIGQSVAAALRAQGRAYRVVGRREAPLRQEFGADPLAEITTWDPSDPGSVQAAARGIDTLVYLVGVDYWRFELHPQLMRQTLDGAIAAGVKRVLLIGTVYPYGRPQATPLREDHPRAAHTFKGRMRQAQEDVLWQAAATGAIEACVLRLPDFYGPGVEASFLHRAAVAAVRGGTADLIGPIDTPHEFVFVPDVGPVVAKLVDTPAAFGRTPTRSWHLAGAGVTSQLALVQEMERQTGRPLKRRVMGKAMLRLAGLFAPFMRELVEMHYLQTEPVLMDDSALRQLIGPVAKTPYAEGVRQMLAAESRSIPVREARLGAA